MSLTPIGQIIPGRAGFHGDVWAHNGFAYLGTWGLGGACPATGVKIIDIADPAAPVWASTVAAFPGTSQEDIVVRAVSTTAFSGDLLAVGIQRCAGGVGAAGLALYDVSNPHSPVELGFFETGARGVHELDLIQRGSRVLALLAVPNSEVLTGTGDFRIVDVSDPRRPLQIAHWGIGARLGVDPRGGIGCNHRIYDHSARASADGRLAYLSYLDAGVVVLDIGDPTNPRVLGRITYPQSEEGMTHSVAEAGGGRYLLVADEDTVFDTPDGVRLTVHTAEGPRTFAGCESTAARSLEEAGLIESGVVDGGSTCSRSADAPVRGRVVVMEDDGCSFSEVASRLAAQGARALVVGVQGGPHSFGGTSAAPIPVVIVSPEDARTLRQLAAAEPSVSLPSERRWSGLRIWDVGDLSNPRQVSVFQTPNSLAFPRPSAGYFTVHNAEVVDDLAVLSWYTDGVRVIDISDPAAPREVASYVPPPEANPQRGFFPDATMVWGVFIAGDLVLASDVNSGLHILRLTIER